MEIDANERGILPVARARSPRPASARGRSVGGGRGRSSGSNQGRRPVQEAIRHIVPIDANGNIITSPRQALPAPRGRGGSSRGRRQVQEVGRETVPMHANGDIVASPPEGLPARHVWRVPPNVVIPHGKS
jgi:hypothetical protein